MGIERLVVCSFWFSWFSIFRYRSAGSGLVRCSLYQPPVGVVTELLFRWNKFLFLIIILIDLSDF